MVSRNLWHIDAQIDGKKPVQILSQPGNVSYTRWVRRPHLNIDDLRQVILRDAVKGPSAILESLALQEGTKALLNLVDGMRKI